MEAYRTFDLAEIWTVLGSNGIFETVFEDGVTNVTDYRPDVTAEVWVRVHQDNQTIALYRFNRISTICLQAHAHVLLAFRKKYSLESAKLALNWLYENIEGIHKVIAHCPENYHNVYKFLKKFGFKDEGYNRESWKVGGEIYGQYLLGLTKSEFFEGRSDG